MAGPDKDEGEERQANEDNGEKGIVPFLADVIGAFLGTLVLMVYCTNFIMFTGLPDDATLMSLVFDTGGGMDECHAPCLDYPQLEVVEQAMAERDIALRKKLCRSAYGEKQEDCWWVGAYLTLIWNKIVLPVYYLLRRFLWCGPIKAFLLFATWSLMVFEAFGKSFEKGFALFMEMIGTGVKAGTATARAAAAGAEALGRVGQKGGEGEGKKKESMGEKLTSMVLELTGCCSDSYCRTKDPDQVCDDSKGKCVPKPKPEPKSTSQAGGRRSQLKRKLYTGGGGEGDGGRPPSRTLAESEKKAIVEDLLFNDGRGSKETRAIMKQIQKTRDIRRIMTPSFPYGLWFETNRKQAIELARGPGGSGETAGTAEEYKNAQKAKLQASNPDFSEFTIDKMASAMTEEMVGERAQKILNGDQGVINDQAAAGTVNTSKGALLNHTGIFKKLGDRNDEGPPLLVTGFTPFESGGVFSGGKWGNWLAAATSGTEILYSKSMEGLSNSIGTLPLPMRLILSLVVLGALGGSIYAGPVAVLKAGTGIFSALSLLFSFLQARTAPLGLGFPLTKSIGVWGWLLAFLITGPVQALLKTISCVWALTFRFVWEFPKAAKKRMFDSVWAPALVLLSLSVIASAWRRLDIYQYVPLSVTIATALAVYSAISKWASAPPAK